VLSLTVILSIALVFVIKDAIEGPHVEPGRKAPKFSFKTDDGHTVSRNEFGGKLLVLNFWASWCAPCIEEMPTLKRFAADGRSAGIVVAAVSIDRSEESYRRFIENLRPTFFTFRDPASEISYKFGTFQIPETYVIDRSGRVRQKYISYQNWADPTIIKEIRGFLQE
jgi:cytochrome c biogenesis protein CcmG/thiol:disulfide interchange protein DsbE